ncbi:protein of unknown function - conserved [Leishmania donovani]|uniref:Uncharacterized protein n=3 Tax=Leishmania donovani species complex TaxID=38574 RepID=A4I4H4_LEIIN|nr:conserved hypothetical protein [Leishmania infantum JPCM5]TPP50786.1 hypothetical protein CGC20_25495 [Leishmania donovani]CAC9508313.1 hypothetical_protein_-_conserved [Leishmania infantum]CAJ1990597.1 protein of unknown function - conserved [Leishmania donovani]CAM69685.1 conserved hypothetical protein [Leishmania infantum JPCM5]SUZ43625.1 hypothetical_protein_-_conserved [Leishmania infantum]|eukprot:XP_001466643.1 conserved hypothetical protein [Leishmania infantum JPCM5]
MITATADAGSAAKAAATPPARLFDCLDAASKERVTMLLSHYQVLLPVEQASFMQELERYNQEQQTTALARNKAGEVWIRYTNPRLQAVQARDPAYVQRLISHTAASRGSKGDEASEEATAPCSLEDLVHTRGMFGEPEGVPIRVGKMSLYEKLHQNMRNRRSTAGGSLTNTTTSSIPTAADPGHGAARVSVPFGPFAEAEAKPAEGKREVGDNASPKTSAQSESGERAVALACADTFPSHTSSVRPSAPYRNNAYQAVRLAMNSPGYTATTQPTSVAELQTPLDGVKPVLNTTAFPITEEELRDWFDELDVHGRGVLSVEEFQRYMQALERDLGVPTEYATLELDGAPLAKDGWLNFEAFSYLVLRFARA